MLASSIKRTQKRDWLLVDLAFVIFVQLGILFITKASGFLAISDDDYSRVVIAQHFVEAPSWDPSGTSWLPLPFLINGAVMSFSAASLEIARWVSGGLAICSALTIYASSTLLGCSRWWRLATSVISISLPYAAYMGAATVPEYPTAAALVFAAASLAAPPSLASTTRSRVRLFAALLLFAATASRYEAWPAALAFAGWCSWDVLKPERPNREKFLYFVCAIISVTFPLIWLLHGAIHHGEAFFFVRRVVSYKEALGTEANSTVVLAFSYLTALFSKEPELSFGVLVGLLALKVTRSSSFSPHHFRAVSLFAFLLLVLSLGAIRGGAPTHHPERALLSLWLFAPLLLGALLAHISPLPRRELIAAAFAVIVGFGFRQSKLSPREDFVDRFEEETLGRWLKETLSSTEKVAIAPENFGYFALMSAAGSPDRFTILESHDPREERKEEQAKSGLSAWFANGGCFYIAPRELIRRGDLLLKEEASLALMKSQSCL